ncbi:MAG: hypothetical protein ACRCWD_07575 [Culicoidibacterales bacterium]
MANRQERKQARKQKKGLRVLLIILIFAVIAIGGGGTVFLLNTLNTETPTQTPEQISVSLSTKLTETQAAVKSQRIVGDYQELELLTTDAVAQIFTYMPLSPETQFHGTGHIIPERRQDYLEFLKTTLYFYYKDLVTAYGEDGLPVVANIEIVDTFEDDFTDEMTDETVTAYKVAVNWDYEESPATIDSEQEWPNTGTFTWIYNEEQNTWFLVDFTTEHDDTLAVIDAFTTTDVETPTE